MHLLAITPGEGFDPARWGPVLQSGIDALLLREPGMEVEAVAEAARWCREVRPGVRLWVRGLAVAGCGLHLPEGSAEPGPGTSRPLHTEAQWEARREAAQLLVSPLFETPGKGPAWGPERLRAFLDRLPEDGPQLLALGGVTPGNAALLRHPRLAGIAAIRPFWTGEPAAAAAAFREAWHLAAR